MSKYSINCDNEGEFSLIKERVQRISGQPHQQGGALPRKTKYGDAPGLLPVGDYADMLVDPKDYKEVIQDCHEKKLFPMYHQNRTWAPPGFRWTQNGLNYCWSWSGIAAFMDLQAREGKRKLGDELLAPVTMGWLVNWRNAGNYLEDFIRGMIERGCATASCVPRPHSTSYKQYTDGWEETALQNRLAKDSVFDTDSRNMLQHALSVLHTGTAGYSAWNRLSHAMSVDGLIWDETKYNNVIWVVRNSHDEDDYIEMHGRNAEPDEFFGLNASRT